MSEELPNKNARLNEQSKKAIDGVFELIAGNSKKGTIERAQSINLKPGENDYKEVGEAWQSAAQKASNQTARDIDMNPESASKVNNLISQSDDPNVQKAALLINKTLNKLFKKSFQTALSQQPAFQKPLLQELLNNQEKQQSKNQDPKQHGKFTQKVLEGRQNPNGLKR